MGIVDYKVKPPDEHVRRESILHGLIKGQATGYIYYGRQKSDQNCDQS